MKKILLWRATLLAASLSSIMSAQASPFEGEEQEKQRALSVQTQMTVTKEVKKRKRAPSNKSEKKQARVTRTRESLDEQDNPSLGHLEKLPPEVLALIFSYDDKPLRLRRVSAAFKAIIDTHLPLRLEISTLDGMIPNFIQGRRVCLEGWVHDLKALKERFPAGTIFKGGNLTSFDIAALSELPPLATGTLVITQDPKTDDEKRQFEKNLPVGIEVRWLQSLWGAFMHSPPLARLTPQNLAVLNHNQQNLAFLLGTKNGRTYLEVLASKGIYATLLPNFQLRIEIVNPLARFGEGVDAQGRVAAVLNALNPEILTRLTYFEELKAFLYGFACLPDQGARLKAASALRPEMLLYDSLFFKREDTSPSGFDQLLTFLKDDSEGKRAALMSRLDVHKFYNFDRYAVVFSVLEVLSKRSSMEEAVSLSALMTKNLVNAFVTQAMNGVRTLNVNDFSKTMEGLASIPSQNKQKQLLSASRERGKISRTALINYMDTMTKIKKFTPLLQKIDLNKINKACLKDASTTAYVLYALLAVDEGDALHLSKLITQDFLCAFDTEDPLGIKTNHAKTRSLRNALSGLTLKDALRALAALPTKKREAVVSLMSADLLARTCEPGKNTLRGDHAVNLIADLLDDLLKEKPLKTALSLVTPRFLNLFLKEAGYERDSLKEALRILMSMDNVSTRSKAMGAAYEKFHSQQPETRAVLEFLRQTLGNGHPMQIDTLTN